MKHFYLIVNSRKEGTWQLAEEIETYLHKNGAVCQGARQESQTLFKGTYPEKGKGYTSISSIPLDTQCVITLGGDGTLIQAARELVDLNLPLVGINMGHLGYLTQVPGDKSLFAMLDALLEDRFTVEKRMMLEGRIIRQDSISDRETNSFCRMKGIALNDIVLTHKEPLQVLNFQIYLNGTCLNEYMADGMIAATPTGSTGYNLSAGGPVVAPGAELIVLTPISSHSLNSRSIVLSVEDVVTIRPLDLERKQQVAVFDGDQMTVLEPGDVIEIRRSEKYTSMIQMGNAPFLENLRNKLARI